MERRSEIHLRDQAGGAGATCRRILEALPRWFGIPASVDEYVAFSEHSPCVVATLGGEDVGILTIVSHGDHAAEVFVMGVVPDLHRRGIGRTMLRHAETGLARTGVEFLQVKTLSATREDEGYEKTRAFYLSYGFRPLEELPGLWGPESPALLMVKAVTPTPTHKEG